MEILVEIVFSFDLHGLEQDDVDHHHSNNLLPIHSKYIIQLPKTFYTKKMSTFTTVESRMKLPSTIDYAFLQKAQRIRSTFYLDKRPVPKAYLNYFLAQDKIDNFPISSLTRYIQKNLQPIPNAPLDPIKLEKLEACFDRVIKYFTSRSGILSEIKREYSLVIQSLFNIEKETQFLTTKSQGLLCQNGTDEMVEKWRAERRDLEEICQRLETNRKVRVDYIKEKEHLLILHLGKLFKKELSETTDDRQRLFLQYKGRMGYIKDWLADQLNQFPILSDLYQDVDQNPQYYRVLFERDDEAIQKFDAPEVKRVKVEIAEQRKRGDILKKEVDKMQKKVETLQKLAKEKEQRGEELRLLLNSRVKRAGGNLDDSTFFSRFRK